MKTTLLGLVVTMASITGCAHGTLMSGDPTPERDVRGGARVGQAARAIVAGPAVMVHARGEKPVRWFVVDLVSGGDTDCELGAARAATTAPVSESTKVQMTIGPGHMLCAAVAQGATDVMWHQVIETSPKMWALR